MTRVDFQARLPIGKVVIGGQTYFVQATGDMIRALRTVQESVNAGESGITAAGVANTPAGGIAATTVQAALDELDTEKQPKDATLTAVAGVATAADKLIYWSGVGVASACDFTAFARSLVAGANAVTVRSTLGLATVASTGAASDLSGLGANVATFLSTPSSANLAAAVTGETGSGALVFGTAPTLASPVVSGTLAGESGIFNNSVTTPSLKTADPSTGAGVMAIDSYRLSLKISGTEMWRFQEVNGHLVPLTGLTDLGTPGFPIRNSHYSGNVECVGSIKSTGTAGIGYGTGAGGTVTQLTNKSTGVTLNKVSGEITMNAAALAAGASVSFVLTNSTVAATDVLILNHVSGGTAGAYTLNAQAGAGTASINVCNVTAGSLSEAIVIRFAVIKGATA